MNSPGNHKSGWSDFLSFMDKVIWSKVNEYSIRLRYIQKGNSPEMIEREIQAYKMSMELPPNKRLIAEYYMRDNRPTVAYAIGLYSTNIATGIRW